MQTLAIDRELFMMAFGHDVDYHDMIPQRTWLDRGTGDVLWLYEYDEDAFLEAGIPAGENREERERVEADPEALSGDTSPRSRRTPRDPQAILEL